MQNFKAHWQITKSWQLIFPVVGIIILVYLSYKFSSWLFSNIHFIIVALSTIIIFYGLLKFFLFLFKKLEKKWILPYRWQMIRVFLVFAITGSTSTFIGRPIIKAMGINQDNLGVVFYWVLYILIGFIFYQILLVCLGWLFGQFQFFWNFEKKMLRHFGFKRFLD